MKALTKTQYEAIATGIRQQAEREFQERLTLDQQETWGRNINRTDNEARISTLAELVVWYIGSFSETDKNFNERLFRISCGFLDN